MSEPDYRPTDEPFECWAPERIPNVDFPWPQCPVCDDGTELGHDDDWWCSKCYHAWHTDGTRGVYCP